MKTKAPGKKSSPPPSEKLRKIPAVEKVLQALEPFTLPRPVVLAIVREKLAALRQQPAVPGFDEVIADIRATLDSAARQRLQPVINGAGIIVHTNLGRSPLSPAALDMLRQLGGSYNNLEFDLETGERGSRGSYLEKCLAILCEAEAATVVNNCAAALVLILRHFTRDRKEVLISRGELVQIGGGFRIPEILQASGAVLREVGTTNKTTVADYERNISAQTGLLLKVHRSNFYMDGFVESPSTLELSALARAQGVPFVEDLGSGPVVDTKAFGCEHEPRPAELLKAGVDLVCFSGDKLLGGPQAGIIAGQRALIAELKREPFFRALRCDKLVLGALQATVEEYLQPGETCLQSIPILAMTRCSVAELEERAARIIATLQGLPLSAKTGKGLSQIGGGALPRSTIPSVTLDLVPSQMGLEKFAGLLRNARPPVIGYISGRTFKLDLRTVFPSQDQQLGDALRAVFQPASQSS